MGEFIMRIGNNFIRAGFVLVALLGFSSIASAQATRTWVSGVGDDANPCSRTAPCKTFAGAISKTATNGEINVLDPGGFGGVTITKSITIDGGGFIASALVSGTNGIVINAPAGSNIVLRNIQVMGLNTGIDGVRFLAGGSLTLDNVNIQQFGGSGGDGLEFAPSTGTSRLTIKNSTFLHNGTTNGNGVLIRPTATGAANATIIDSTFTSNRTGLRAEPGSTVSVTRSQFNSNTISGVEAATAGSGNVLVNLDTVTANNNGQNGFLATGSNGAFILMSNCSLYANNNGLSRVANGQIISFQNNSLGGNAVDGTPSGNLNQF
jgi:hypothetical protein